VERDSWIDLARLHIENKRALSLLRNGHPYNKMSGAANAATINPRNESSCVYNFFALIKTVFSSFIECPGRGYCPSGMADVYLNGRFGTHAGRGLVAQM